MGVTLSFAVIAGALVPAALMVTAPAPDRIPRLATLATVWAVGAAGAWLALHRREPAVTPVLLGVGWAVVALGVAGGTLVGRGVVTGVPLGVPLAVTVFGAGLGAWAVLRRQTHVAVAAAGIGLVVIGAVHVGYALDRLLTAGPSSLDVLVLVALVVAGGIVGLGAAAFRAWELLCDDVTDTARQRETARRELAALRSAQAELLHETRNVLLAVDGASHVLDHDTVELPEQDRRELERAVRTELRLLRCVTDRARGRRLPTSGATCVREVTERQARLARERGVDVTVRVEGAPVTTMPSEALEEVLLNLLLNAERHGKGAAVELGARREPTTGQLRLTVADRGPGLHAGSGTTGSGLGLAICRRLVSSVGGHLTLRAREGGGVIAVVTLPGAPALPPGPTTERDPAPANRPLSRSAR
jgi:signal transduction histidine kinase